MNLVQGLVVVVLWMILLWFLLLLLHCRQDIAISLEEGLQPVNILLKVLELTDFVKQLGRFIVGPVGGRIDPLEHVGHRAEDRQIAPIEKNPRLGATSPI
mmetsp:Transcript_31774/g.68106  ORF Transcript_31774/g.68106 Transcript_31774/m.68106 type:complete len:100 (+) Transcript_31774:1037-1336(+)